MKTRLEMVDGVIRQVEMDDDVAGLVQKAIEAAEENGEAGKPASEVYWETYLLVALDYYPNISNWSLSTEIWKALEEEAIHLWDGR